jgi:hypothetical protein
MKTPALLLPLMLTGPALLLASGAQAERQLDHVRVYLAPNAQYYHG